MFHKKVRFSTKKLVSMQPFTPLKVQLVKKSSVAKLLSKKSGKSKVKLTPEKAIEMARTVAPVLTPAKTSSHIDGRLTTGTTTILRLKKKIPSFLLFMTILTLCLNQTLEFSIILVLLSESLATMTTASTRELINTMLPQMKTFQVLFNFHSTKKNFSYCSWWVGCHLCQCWKEFAGTLHQ